jgi:ADP-L-glycero-D-manno-heptose 6-epimerase
MRHQQRDGLEWIGLRYTNVFGDDEADKGEMASILSQLVRQAARSGEIRLFEDSLTAARDYIPVEAVARTIVQLARQANAAAVYNLGSGFAVSFAELVEWCAQLYRGATGNSLRVQLVANPKPAAYQYFTCADISLIEDALACRVGVFHAALRARVAQLFESAFDCLASE